MFRSFVVTSSPARAYAVPAIESVNTMRSAVYCLIPPTLLHSTPAGRVRVKTVASRPSERAAAVADSVGAELTGDVDAALRDPEVDVVDVCLPTGLHRETADHLELVTD